MSYNSAGYGLGPKDLWRPGFPVLVGFFILFQLMQILALEFYPQYGLDLSKRRAKGVTNEKEEIGDKVHARPTHCLVFYREVQPVKHRKTLTWENLNYHVPSANGPLWLLHDVQGFVKPGTLTALMGASGADVNFSNSVIHDMIC
ncbi:hypothetical protein CPB84DRAFT_1859405 [Gymnopilus junonius]|uniref:Uncharacterized protein n=1 Tax=Gymnopilus junonius TaxID=109634 RepID=A0A9P5TEA1_GYMJU|nr:hypothetical protein CPB84DRAFT_1859405 [Gymnopilus junonius]